MAQFAPYYQNNSDLQKFTLDNVQRTGVKLGAGSFGTVEEVEMAGTLYAGKIWHEALLDPQNEGVENMIRRFAHECELMQKAHHPNIVQFMGVCFLESSPYPILVMERLDISLDNLLQTRQNIPLPLKLHVLHDVTKGLVHLHGMKPSIVHRDLTTCNVLLNKHSLNAKIADLGNARMIGPGKLSKTLSKNPGTQVYMPPESAGIDPVYDASLDVFSFGHLALYVLSEAFPCNLLPATYHDPKTYTLHPRSELERRERYLDILHTKIGKTHALVNIIERCLNNVPQHRPKSEVIMQEISAMIKNCEDDFEIIHGLGKLEMFDREMDRSNSVSTPHSAVDNPIKPGVPELLDIYTVRGSAIRRKWQGWKQYVFQISDTALIYKKTNKEEIINTLPLKNITFVNAVKNTQFSDATKFYFEVQFNGDGSPWLLRAYTKDKRVSWIKTLAKLTQQSAATANTESYATMEYIPSSRASTVQEAVYEGADLYNSMFPGPTETYENVASLQRDLPPLPGKVDSDEADDDPEYAYPLHTLPCPSPGPVSSIDQEPDSQEQEPKSSPQELEPESSPDSPQEQVPKSSESPGSDYHQQAVMSSNSPPSSPKGLYEELKDVTRDKISPYAVCYPTPAEIAASKTTQSQDVLIETTSGAPAPKALEFNPSSHCVDGVGAISGSESLKCHGISLQPVSHGDDKPAKYSQSTSEEYEDMTSQDPCSGAYEVPTEKAQDVFEDPAGGYAYIPNDEDIQEARNVPHSLTASKLPYLRSQSTGNLIETVTSRFHGHLQSADPTTLQLNILQQMQEVLAQIQSTYGQTQLPGRQSKVTQETARPSSALKANVQESEKIVKPGAATPQKMETCLRELLNTNKKDVGQNQPSSTGDKSDPTNVLALARASTTTDTTSTDSSAATPEKELKSYVISTSSLSEKELVPKGRFGEIHHAKLKRLNSTVEVIVKTLKKIDDKNEQSDFLKEQSIMSELVHPNIVRFHGITDDDIPSIVLEFLPNGDLQTFLKNNKRPIKKLLKYMLDVAMGMHYIAGKRLVHRDLAARNILVGKDETCKVGDFGLLRKLRKASSTDPKEVYVAQSTTPLPIRWMAPESLDCDLKQFSTASDVWSFAVLQWEMKNVDSIPYSNIPDDELRTRVLYKGLRLDIPEEYPPDVQSQMEACWNQDPTERPSFLLIYGVIVQHIDDVNE